jgi:hypothetical protein
MATFEVTFLGACDRVLYTATVAARNQYKALVHACRTLPQKDRIQVQCWTIKPAGKMRPMRRL